MDERIKLRDGRVAKVSFLSKKDDTKELLRFINALVKEGACILYDKRFTLKEEEKWKEGRLKAQKDKGGYILVARVDGKLAADTGCTRGQFKEDGNACLGVAVAKEFRGLGLGEALLKLNLKTCKKFFGSKPKNIWLSVFATNRAAYGLYRKLKFKEFAVFPKWLIALGLLELITRYLREQGLQKRLKAPPAFF
jgi:ribosomal protein S18 acetylase RimI-like enzyme